MQVISYFYVVVSTRIVSAIVFVAGLQQHQLLFNSKQRENNIWTPDYCLQVALVHGMVTYFEFLTTLLVPAQESHEAPRNRHLRNEVTPLIMQITLPKPSPARC